MHRAKSSGRILTLFTGLAALAAAIACQPAHAVGYDVGVIMNGSCPGGAAPLRILIDNEDSNAQSHGEGWVGSTHCDGNTDFYFCRADGHQFFHVPGSPYLVLSLGSYCPNGSLTVRRHFDAEDDHTWNPPISTTTINWSAEGLPGEVVVSGGPNGSYLGDVEMTFCLFDGNGYQTGPMPTLGVDYGVFAPPGTGFAIAQGLIYTDDRDSNFTTDRWAEDISGGFRSTWSFSVTGISRNYGSGAMEGGEDTWLRTAKVRGTVCSDGVCSGSESCGSCPQDCGACPVCGNSWCEPNEYCPEDCGFCGDGLCGGGENCTSCCADCGVCFGNPWECAMPSVMSSSSRTRK